jgi:OHCU decarboxylase
MQLDALNRLDADSAARELLQCCGSTRWARMMAAARPFQTAGAMAVTADVVWTALAPADWLEAFAAHPRIGEKISGAPAATPSRGHGNPRRGVSESSRRGWGPGAIEKSVTPADSGDWAAHEQAGAVSASEAIRDRLAARNRDYEARFGYIFVVCATGKSADEMLEIVERRLANDPAVELQIAADEQRKITRLRLAKLVEADQGATR